MTEEVKIQETKNKVKMAKGYMDAYVNISSSISGKSSEPIDYENG